MEDMAEITNASWVSKSHTSEENKTLNALMAKNQRDKSSESSASAQKWTTNAILGT